MTKIKYSVVENKCTTPCPFSKKAMVGSTFCKYWCKNNDGFGEYMVWCKKGRRPVKKAESRKPRTQQPQTEICPHWKVYNKGCSGEFGRCDCNGKLSVMR